MPWVRTQLVTLSTGPDHVQFNPKAPYCTRHCEMAPYPSPHPAVHCVDPPSARGYRKGTHAETNTQTHTQTQTPSPTMAQTQPQTPSLMVAQPKTQTPLSVEAQTQAQTDNPELARNLALSLGEIHILVIGAYASSHHC